MENGKIISNMNKPPRTIAQSFSASFSSTSAGILLPMTLGAESLSDKLK